MKIQKVREILVEYERIQLIRKRARTSVEFCGECNREVDFMPLMNAAKLFETEADVLFSFIKNSGSHSEITKTGATSICLNSLLVQMKLQSSHEPKNLFNK